MKILAITARYPPYHFGGYELRGKNIIDELSRRGHEILVITSIPETKRKIPFQPTAYPVLRKLQVELHAGSFISRLTLHRWSYLLGMAAIFIRSLILDWMDLRFIDKQIQAFHPDVIYLGHITVFTRTLMPFLSSCPIPIVCDEGGSGVIDSWEEKAIWYKFVGDYAGRVPIIEALKAWMAKLVGRMSAGRMKSQWSWPADLHVFFNSELNCRNALAAGVPLHGPKVIHSGIDTVRFSFAPRAKLTVPLTLIVPGRIEPRKGQMDAVKLLAKLREQGLDAKLLLVGERWTGSYYMEIEQAIGQLHLEDKVSFLPMIGQDKLIELYHQAEVCFFPSYYGTGFSRVPLEAMACGCMIISYGNEGSDEIIQDRRTGFLVSPADYEGIACLLKELDADPRTFGNILAAARKRMEDDCSMSGYVDQIENFIAGAVNSHGQIPVPALLEV